MKTISLILFNKIINSIYKDCVDNEQETITGSFELIIDGNPRGEVSYIVSQEIHIKGHGGYADNPPERTESDFYLIKAKLNGLVNENCIELTNVQNQINNALKEAENKIIYE